MLVLVCVARQRSHALLQQAGHFDLSARSHAERARGALCDGPPEELPGLADWRADTGALLDDCSGWVDCSVRQSEAGDHSIVIGEVSRAARGGCR
jgi:flavin reductase (DIM6/NTAB) family NADH-FMN oxidoreductase RutF